MKTIFKIVLTIMIIGLTLSSIIGYQLGRHWNIRQVGYRMYQGLVDYGWVRSINNAARTWCNAGANFQFNHTGYSTSISYGQDGVNIITYTNWSIDPTMSAFSLRYPLGSNDPIEECDMIFNMANQSGFATNGSPYRMDVESVALHEFGHWLALEHENSIPEAVMYGTLNAGQIKRALHTDDVAGIRALYGNRPNSGGCGGGGGNPCTRVFLAGQIIAEYVFAQTINQELYRPGSYGEDLLMHIIPDCNEPVRILDEHPELLAEINSVIMANLDYAESQLTNNPKTLTREQIDEFSRLIYSIIEYASPELQEALFRLVVYLEKSEGKNVQTSD